MTQAGKYSPRLVRMVRSQEEEREVWIHSNSVILIQTNRSIPHLHTHPLGPVTKTPGHHR